MIGTGYVGLVSGVCFSDVGNVVYCVDKDRNKIDSLNKGKVPIYEPGLEEILKRNYKAKRLFFTSDLNEAVKKSDIKGVKICRQAKAYWVEEFDKRKNPLGQEYYWLTGKFVNKDQGEDTDEWALKNNYISIVPVEFDLTAHHAIQGLNEWDFK